MVKTRLMVAQQDQGVGIDKLETFVSDGACPKTLRVDMHEQRIQGLTVNVQLLMEQNREIIQELRG